MTSVSNHPVRSTGSMRRYLRGHVSELAHPQKREKLGLPGFLEADDGARTRDLRLGKPTLYQLSYVRKCAEMLAIGTSNPDRDPGGPRGYPIWLVCNPCGPRRRSHPALSEPSG